MRWRLEYSEDAKRQKSKLDKPMRLQVEKYLDKLLTLHDPRTRGKGLTGNLAGKWRYRVGDYRIICEIHDDVLVVLVLSIGHRSKVYK